MRSVRLNFEAAQLAVHRKPFSPKHSFLHFPHAKCRTFFSSAAWQYAFQLGSWLGPRLLVAKDKEKKNYRRENLETTVSSFSHAIFSCALYFFPSLCAMSSRKRTLAREQGQAPPEISICPISSTKTHRRQLASRRTGDPWIRNST